MHGMKKLVFLLSLLLLFSLALFSSANAETGLSVHGWVGTKTAYSMRTNLGNIYPTEDMDSNRYTHMRGRMRFEFKPYETVGAVWYNEIDYDFGRGAYGFNNQTGASVNRGFGGGLGADTVNVETKQLHIYFTPKQIPVKVTAGIKWVTDDFDWIIIGNDAAGFTFDYGPGDTKIRAGAYRLWEQDISEINDEADLYKLSASHKFPRSTRLGVAGYYLRDDGAEGNGALNVGPSPVNGFASLSQNAATGFNSLIPTGVDYDLNSYFLGLFGKTALSKATSMEAWAIYNFGDVSVEGADNIDINGFAVDARANQTIGNAKLSLEGIYISGTDKQVDEEFGFTNTGMYSAASNFYYKHGMMILLPDGDDWNYSSALLYNPSNIYEDQFLGVYGAFANLYFPIIKRLRGKVGLGTIFSAENRPVNNNNYMATESNLKLTYQLVSNATVALKTAYASIGDFYEVSAAESAASAEGIAPNEDPDDITYTYLELKVTF